MLYPPIAEPLENHSEIKKSLLSKIDDAPRYKQDLENEIISASDYGMNDAGEIPEYADLFLKNCTPVLYKYFSYLGFNVNVLNMWFHQYFQGDVFGWHSHGNAAFALIYYLELPEDGPRTEFSIPPFDFTFTANVKEGDVLIFPAQTRHRSPESKSTERKTIISANLSIIDEPGQPNKY